MAQYGGRGREIDDVHLEWLEERRRKLFARQATCPHPLVDPLDQRFDTMSGVSTPHILGVGVDIHGYLLCIMWQPDQAVILEHDTDVNLSVLQGVFQFCEGREGFSRLGAGDRCGQRFGLFGLGAETFA